MNRAQGRPPQTPSVPYCAWPVRPWAQTRALRPPSRGRVPAGNRCVGSALSRRGGRASWGDPRAATDTHALSLPEPQLTRSKQAVDAPPFEQCFLTVFSPVSLCVVRWARVGSAFLERKSRIAHVFLRGGIRPEGNKSGTKICGQNRFTAVCFDALERLRRETDASPGDSRSLQRAHPAAPRGHGTRLAGGQKPTTESETQKRARCPTPAMARHGRRREGRGESVGSNFVGDVFSIFRMFSIWCNNNRKTAEC